MNVYWPNFEKRDGLITVVAQDVTTRQVLMVAFMDEAGWRETLSSGEVVYFSTSKKERWKKGETSGDVQIVRDILIDCDGDAIVLLIEQCGDGACHTKAKSCFFRRSLGAQQIMPAPKFAGGENALEIKDVDVCERLCL